MRGGSANRSQNLMRARVIAQFAAIVVAMAALWLMGRWIVAPKPQAPKNRDRSPFSRPRAGSASIAPGGVRRPRGASMQDWLGLALGLALRGILAAAPAAAQDYAGFANAGSDPGLFGIFDEVRGRRRFLDRRNDDSGLLLSG